MPKTELSKPKGKHAWTARIGEKGQIVIPKEARDLFGFHPGDTLLLLADEKKGIVIPRLNMFNELFQKVLGEGVLSEEEEE
ncbi:MAG: AbrB/MazE/SpoVT family DNA-binding domain-containing protein [Erysipelotrichaceae bacterium]|jgi:AbrB family looped-hinge helix DNA binding protein|nr:AbrB/MazE/SpoVT family DNA-binding domain-containing protein [Erysipelotrichaceae bacterium]